MTSKPQRIYSLDAARLIAAFLVVTIHCWQFYGRDTLLPISRIAVPYFFLVSGFFLYDPDPQIINRRINQRTLRVLGLWFWGAVTFFISAYFRHRIKGYGLEKIMPNWWTPFDIIIFCYSQIGFYLWFLIAMIEGFFAMKLTSVWYRDRWFSGQKKWIIPSMLIIIGAILNKYVSASHPLLGRESLLYPPVIFMSWPFIYLGYNIRKHLHSINEYFLHRQKQLMLSAVLFTILCIIEGLFAPGCGDNYLTTLPLILPVFILLILHPTMGGKRIAELGQRYALWIYLFHYIVYTWINMAIKTMDSPLLHPITVFSVTLALCILGDHLIRKIRLLRLACISILLFSLNSCSQQQPDQNLYIYLCLGQSNMVGISQPETQDSIVNNRLLNMAAMDDWDRKTGKWRDGIPPLCRASSGLSPADYFGRTMLEYLPEEKRVGLVVVAVNGAAIRLFDKDQYQGYIDSIPEKWMKREIEVFGNNPYQRLVDVARKAQKKGVIKGILLHQGETDATSDVWIKNVQKVYQNLLYDLKLEADSVPLLVGEAVGSDQAGAYQHVNATIDRIPDYIPTAHVISSRGCPAREDHLHFAAEGSRILGKRYAIKMLKTMGYDIPEDSNARLQMEEQAINEAFLVDVNTRENLLLIASSEPLQEVKLISFSGSILSQTDLNGTYTAEIDLSQYQGEGRIVLSFLSLSQSVVNKEITLYKNQQ